MLTGIRLAPDGTMEKVWLTDSQDEGRRGAWMREHIGCTFYDVIRLPEGIDCWVDDEFLFNPDTNPDLTRILHRHQPCGPVGGAGLFLGVNEATGETVSLTLDQEVTVITWWRTVTQQGNNPEALRARMVRL